GSEGAGREAGEANRRRVSRRGSYQEPPAAAIHCAHFVSERPGQRGYQPRGPKSVAWSQNREYAPAQWHLDWHDLRPLLRRSLSRFRFSGSLATRRLSTAASEAMEGSCPAASRPSKRRRAWPRSAIASSPSATTPRRSSGWTSSTGCATS